MVLKSGETNVERRKIVIANWKMFGNYEFALDFFKKICDAILPEDLRFIICPPFPYIGLGGRIIAEHDTEQIIVGAQNVSHFLKTASTGEVNVEMLEDCLAKAVIVGHSERRAMGEDDAVINKKIKNLQGTEIQAILCIGENEEENSEGIKEDVLKRQIKNALKDVKMVENLFIAYEPIWAIGSGKTPTQDEIAETANFIKQEINKVCKVENLFVLYGGSVNQDNLREMLANSDLDGVMIGGFSTQTKEFCEFFENMCKENWKK